MIIWRIECTDPDTGQIGYLWEATQDRANEVARPLRHHPLGGRGQNVRVCQDRVPTESKIALAQWLTDLRIVTAPPPGESAPFHGPALPTNGIGDGEF